MSLASSVELGIDSNKVFMGPLHGAPFVPELSWIQPTLGPVLNKK